MSPVETAHAVDPRRQLTLARILGHAAARDYLLRSIRERKLPQAILISGAMGVGKRTLGWALAREIVAASEGADAESHSGSHKISRGTHPDVFLLEPNSPSGQLLVDDVRAFEDWASRYPIQMESKIGLLHFVERMNVSSGNALLKLLEEPPQHLQLILICSDPARLLPTIRSRCAPLPLEAVSTEELVPWLVERAKVGADRAKLAAELAEGRPGFALQLLGEGGLEKREKIVREMAALKQHGFASVFGVADRLNSIHPNDASSTLRTLVAILRDALALAMGSTSILNRDLERELRALGDGLSTEGLLEAAMAAETAAAEAPYYFGAASNHFLETLMMRMGKRLRRG